MMGKHISRYVAKNEEGFWVIPVLIDDVTEAVQLLEHEREGPFETKEQAFAEAERGVC